MNILKMIWTFLADLSGVIQTIVYAIIGFIVLIHFLNGNKIFLIIALLLALFVISSIIRWLRTSYKKFSQKVTDIEIDDKIKKLEAKKFNHDISKLLPDNKLIKELGDSLIEKTREWAEDSIIETFTLYLEISRESNDLLLQAQCKSKWKGEEKFIYLGRNLNSTPREILSSEVITTQNLIPFYVQYPNWGKAVAKAYEAIKDQLPDNFELIIGSHYQNALHFSFSYFSGIDKTEAFEMTENTLKNLKSGKTVKI